MTSSWFQDPTLLAAMLGALLPFVSFVLIVVFTRPYPKLSATISVAAVSVSVICALSLLGRHWHLEHPIQYTTKWLVSGELYVPFGFMLDQLSLLMLTIVAVISFLVQVYSLGYMAGDPGFSRYYAFQSLFAWAMMTMTIAPTMLQFYIFWELVGLASYLLIGFYYEKFSASEAGKKAFVMTRVGDIAFFLGILLVLLNFGNLNILDMNSVDVTARMSPALITLSAILIFGGVAGKSAQFPLLTWL
ncbi:MAG: NADH-quinone oxidoreductase subunit L, partial [Deltaproteobacteria bacterium]|nr:NADH-quinone oxidoreductase subunit L [Deltaproteobacteria bacterium]